MFVNSETGWNNAYIQKKDSVNYILKMEVSKGNKRYLQLWCITVMYKGTIISCSFRSHTCLVSKLPSTLSKWGNEIPPWEKQSHPPSTPQSWTYRLASLQSSQCIGIAACHLIRTPCRKTQQIMRISVGKKVTRTLFGERLHNWFLDPERRPHSIPRFVLKWKFSVMTFCAHKKGAK